MQRKSILSRFFTATSALLIATIVRLGILFGLFARRFFFDDRINTLNLCVNNARVAFSDSTEVTNEHYVMAESARIELRENLRLISNTANTILIVADENGRCIVCTQGGDCTHEGSYIPGDVARQLLQSEGGLQLEISPFKDIYEGNFYTVGMAVRDYNGAIIGYVFAFASAESLSVFIGQVVMLFMLCGGAMILVSNIVSIFAADRLTTPLRKISESARNFSKGDFSVRATVEGDDEVAQLAGTFNQLADFVERNESSRSSFIANIAHELRTPMTSIKGFVDGMLDGTIPQDRQQAYLTAISDEVGRLARLTNSMLDISKLESGEFNMTIAPYNIWDTIAGIAFSFENRIDEKNITLLGFEPTKVLVNADQDLIHQVVYNIFDNAIKFCPQDGTITLSVSEEKNPEHVLVKIRNSGEGISPDVLPYIFDRFYKADTSRSVHVKGAGIGLYIVRTLVLRSGGDIHVDSDGATYTEFSFTLPRGRYAKPTKEKKEKSGGTRESLFGIKKDKNTDKNKPQITE